MLARLGGWSFQHPRKMVGAWVALIVVVIGSTVAVGAAFDAGFEIPDSESRRGFDALDTHFGGFGSGQSGSIVFRSEVGVDDPAVRAPMEALFAEVAAIDGVVVSSPYDAAGAGQVGADRTIAYAALSLSADLDFTATANIGAEIGELAPVVPGLQIEVGGAALAEFEPPESEFIGLAFAVIVLILAFGSVLAMGLPLAVAVAGVGVGAGLIALISNLTTVPDFATTIGAMIGLGVGIDYALFVVTRYREGLDAGQSPLQATVTAMDTAGRAVIFAGLTVVISLLGMLIMGLSFITGLALGAAATVAVTMVASVTLLPALLGLVRERVEVTRWRALVAAGLISVALLGVGLGLTPLMLAAPVAILVYVVGRWVPAFNREVPSRPKRPRQETLAYRWSRAVQAHPWVALIVGSGLLLVLAAPVLSLRLGFSDEGNYPERTTTRRAYDLLADGFGPGFNGPLLVTAEVGTPADRAALPALVEALAAAPGVASVGPPLPSDPGDPDGAAAYLIRVAPDTSPQDEATTELVEALRSEAVPSAVAGTTLAVNVTGTVAANIDFSDYLAQRIVLFFGAVLALSFLLLMVVFRSVLVPVKAVVMNVLSIGCRVRDHRRGVPVGLVRRAAGHRGRADRAVHPDDDVRDRLRPLDGLRGVPALARQGGVRSQRRRRRLGGRRAGLDGACDHGRGGDHGRRLRELRLRGRPHHQAVRHRACGGHPARRDRGEDAARARDHGVARRAQLVAARLAQPDAAAHQYRAAGGPCPSRPRSAPAKRAHPRYSATGATAASLRWPQCRRRDSAARENTARAASTLDCANSSPRNVRASGQPEA